MPSFFFFLFIFYIAPDVGCTEDEGPHLDSVSAALAQGTLGTQWRLAELVHFVGWSVSFSWGHTVTLGLAARDPLRSMVLTFPTLMPQAGTAMSISRF